MRCCDVARWAANLTAQRAIRWADATEIPPDLDVPDLLGEVGHVAQRSQQNSAPLEDVGLQLAGWRHPGWMFHRQTPHHSFDGTGPLAAFGFRRQGTFVAIRTFVDRPSRVAARYDVRAAVAVDGHPGWA